MSTASADTDFSGIWKDSQNQFYSIHQSGDSILIAELRSEQAELSTFEYGHLLFTNNQLDFAISGAGFFILEGKDGNHRYTREGHFLLAANGTIVNEQGEKLVTEKEIVLPANLTELVIEDNGTINQRDGNQGLIKLNRIKLASIAPKDILYDSDRKMTARNKEAVTYFYPAEDHGGVVLQGALEILNYTARDWTAYTGKLIGNYAAIKELSKQNKHLLAKEITFENEFTANLEITGALGPILPFYKNEDRQLRKVF
jgi:flagellar basal body rod protein FlgF